MSTTARFPAADVAIAATAIRTRLQAQFDGPDGPRIVNTAALYRSMSLIQFATAAARTSDATVALDVDDFGLIGPDLPQSSDVSAT